MSSIPRSLIGAVVMCGAMTLIRGSAAVAQDKPVAPAAKLPLSKVVLFSSGVGYFEHQNQIDGERF